MSYKHIKVPKKGEKVIVSNGKVKVPSIPIIPFIEGDGIGTDITPAMIAVVDESVKKAMVQKNKYHGWKFIVVKNLLKYMEKMNGSDETIDALKSMVLVLKDL